MAFKQNREAGSKLGSSSTFNNFSGNSNDPIFLKARLKADNRRNERKKKRAAGQPVPHDIAVSVGGIAAGADALKYWNNSPGTGTMKGYLKSKVKGVKKLFQ